MRRAGRPLDAAWILPSTVPHSGPYLLKLDVQRPEVVKQPAVQRLAATIPALDDAIQEQAAAVVESDTVRAAAAAAYQAGGRSIDSLSTCVQGQTAETLCVPPDAQRLQPGHRRIRPRRPPPRHPRRAARPDPRADPLTRGRSKDGHEG